MGGVSRLLIAGLAVVLGAAPAWATVPSPDNSTIPNVTVQPGGSKEYKVIILDVGMSPVPDADVRVIFSDTADTTLCWCVGQVHPVVGATTDVNGEASFFIAAGGCMNPGEWVDPPAKVYANGILMGEVGVVSGDVVDGTGVLPHQGWDPAGTCESGLPDAVYFTAPIQTGVYDFCTDFNSDGAVTLEDAVWITPPIQAGQNCVAQ